MRDSFAGYAPRSLGEQARVVRDLALLPAPAPVLRLCAPAVGYAVIGSAEVKKALDELVKFYAKKSTIPVLGYVHVVARWGKLTLSATDLDKALSVKLDCKGRSYFSLCVPLATLRDMLSRVNDTLSLTLDGYTLVVRKQASGGIIRVKGMNAEEFPTLPSPTHQHYFSIDSAVLGKEIERIARAAASDEARPVFTAIYANVEHGTLTLCAADSYRLHTSKVPVSSQGHAGHALIPAKTLQTLGSILPKKATALHFWVSDALSCTQMAIKWNGHTVYTRLIDGQYPAYERIIPQDSPAHYAVVDAKEALKVVELVGKVVDGTSNNIVSLGWINGRVKQLVVDGYTDEAQQTEYVKADISQESQTCAQYIMLNYRYLADALKSISGYAVLRFWSPKQAPTIRPLETEDTFTAVVMPMHSIR